MLDWGIARQIARFVARSDDQPDLGVDMPGLARDLEPAVLDFTQLPQASPAPAAEVVGRVGWAEANLGTLAGLLDPIARRLDDRLEGAGPFAGALRLGAGMTLSAEVGLLTGYMSQRVLGRYELSLIAPEYKLGKGFCDAVAAKGGIELLNEAWGAPAALPGLIELERPGDWLARVGAAPAAAV